MLEDDGLFYMQVAGLRKGSNWQDTQWGLFMSRYIFPGADASTPLFWYVKQLEMAGFEVKSVETVRRGLSLSLTLTLTLTRTRTLTLTLTNTLARTLTLTRNLTLTLMLTLTLGRARQPAGLSVPGQ